MSEYRPVLGRRGLRLALLVAAVAGVLAAAAGVFVLSYPGTRDTAVAAGVSAPLARVFPAVMDAVVVVACAAAVTLRGALRGYAWLVLLVIAGSVAAADAARAMSVTVPKRPLEATVAIVPWAALLIGLTLLYAMGRQGLPPRRAATAGYAPANGGAPAIQRPGPPPGRPAGPAAVPLSALLDHRPARPATVTDQAAGAKPAIVSEVVLASAVATGSEMAAAPEPAAVGEPAGGPGPALPRRIPRDDPSDPDAGPADPAATPTPAGDQPPGD